MQDRKFCFLCGKKTGELVGGCCQECFGKNALARLPKKMEVTVCGKCGKMLFKNRWTEFSLERILESSAKVSGKMEEIKAETDGKKVKAEFVLVTPSGNVKKETHEAGFHKAKVICPLCSRMHSGYYEGVLQLRGFDGKDLESLMNVFDALGRKTFYHVKDTKGGFDVKIGNKLMIKSLAKNIRCRFPSEMKESSKIVTKIDGRDVHRKFVLLRKR